VKLFLEGKNRELAANLKERMENAADNLRFEEAAALRDLVSTVEELDERQKMAAVDGDNTDILAVHAEPPLVAVNLFHLRNGRIVDRREFYWEDQSEFELGEFISALLKQLYLDIRQIPDHIHVPAAFEDQELLQEFLTEKRGRKVEIHTPQRGQKKAMIDLAATNARHSFEGRFRVMAPSEEALRQAFQETLGLETPLERIECFDISHIQGTDQVASMVVWEKGRMNKSAYRKFLIRHTLGNDDFASMREVVGRRYARVKAEGLPMPSLVLIDGGLGQLHAAAQALEELEILNQPLASIAKREETIYLLGQEDDPIQLDRYSPVLHLVQQIRDEAHRFAVTFHRQRRTAARLTSELTHIPGIGPATVKKLLRKFGSVSGVRTAGEVELRQTVGPVAARRLRAYFEAQAVIQPAP
jgi:excinuclease ABC subunit C